MALVTQLFASETCPCEVIEQWDDALPDDQVVHQLVSVNHRGDEHASVVDKSLLKVIREETHRKTVALAICVTQSPKLAANPSRIHWVFTPGRLLQLSFDRGGISEKTEREIQHACDVQLGLNKVEVL